MKKKHKVAVIIVVIFIAIIVLMSLTPPSRPISEGGCLLTIATLGDLTPTDSVSKVHQTGDAQTNADNDSPMDVLKPWNADNQHGSKSLLLTWVRALLYPPAVRYTFNQLCNPEEIESCMRDARRGSSYYSRFQSNILPLGNNSQQNAAVSMVNTPTGNTNITFTWANMTNALCHHGAHLDNDDVMGAINRSLTILAQRSEMVRHVRPSKQPGNTIALTIPTHHGDLSFFYDLLLGHAHLAQGADYAPCGPFSVAPSTDIDQQKIDLVQYDKGFFAVRNWPASCGVTAFGGARAAKLCFRNYEITVHLEDTKKPDYDILIAGHNPFASHSIPLPEGYSMKVLPVGIHMFAAINTRRIITPDARAALYRYLLRPAVKRMVQAHVILDLDAPGAYWYPGGWGLAATVSAIASQRNLPLRSFDDIPDPGQEHLPTRPLTVMRAYRYANTHNNPLEAALNVQWESLGKPAIAYTTPVGDHWGNADIVLFDSRYDVAFDDPSQLILQHEKQLQDVIQMNNTDWKDNLRTIQEKIFINGPNHVLVVEKSIRAQNYFVDTMILAPLYSMPHYIFYRADMIGDLQINARDGFINMDSWRISDARCSGKQTQPNP